MAEAVRLGQADRLDRWALGDICLEAVPPGKDRAGRSEAQRRLAAFAHDIGHPINLLKDLHRTAVAWPPDMRIEGVSHSKHSKYASHPNRVALVLGEGLDEGLSGRILRDVGKVEKLLKDPAVRAAAMDRTKKRTAAVRQLARAREDEALAEAREHERVLADHAKAMEMASRLPGAGERAMQAAKALGRMYTHLIELQDFVGQIPDGYKDRWVEQLERIRRGAEKLRQELRPESRSPQPHDVIDIVD
ncbi:hypothetical protein [Geodermatophilus normandii]|uniref:hypothetical protein n=1 Tax=Geodermatophilus normandii TaxID=1137989 RepID=UPI0011B84E77|nr:hypothetical protein [Geodermatophilus normandii]